MADKNASSDQVPTAEREENISRLLALCNKSARVVLLEFANDLAHARVAAFQLSSSCLAALARWLSANTLGFEERSFVNVSRDVAFTFRALPPHKLSEALDARGAASATGDRHSRMQKPRGGANARSARPASLGTKTTVAARHGRLIEVGAVACFKSDCIAGYNCKKGNVVFSTTQLDHRETSEENALSAPAIILEFSYLYNTSLNKTLDFNRIRHICRDDTYYHEDKYYSEEPLLIPIFYQKFHI
ncbi:Protein of unknown function [Gryllus bimaculatus]|nr:Protein of unknown function [Gryllus bimaculatus]